MELDVSFVCQPGEIEAMACLLAASLRRHHGDSLHLHVIEPIPHSEYGTVSPAGRKFLDGLGVRWYQRENPISHEYKIFNKLNAFRIDPQTDKTLFLDSDILVRAPLDGLQHYFKSPFAARMENLQRFSGTEAAWKAAYGLFGLEVPAERMPTVDSGEWGPPYFNAGVVLVDSDLDFSEVWSDTCRRIHDADEVWRLSNRQWRGTVQIGMPVAVARLGLTYALLSGAYHIFLNQNMRRQRLNWPEDQVRLVHYNEWTHVLSDERISAEVSQLISDFQLTEIFEAAPETAQFLETLKSADYAPRRSVFLPSSLLSSAGSEPEPRAPATSTRVLRMPGCGLDVVSLGDSEAEVSGEVGSMGPILRLAADLKQDEGLRVILCIDDPVHSLGRWRSNPELWDTTILNKHPFTEEAPNEHLARRLAGLRAADDLNERRAGVWELLATAANQPHPHLRIVRQQDIEDGAAAVLAELEAWSGSKLDAKLLPGGEEPLSPAEGQAIRRVCSYIAGAFGYTL